jgi:hypothetical protein
LPSGKYDGDTFLSGIQRTIKVKEKHLLFRMPKNAQVLGPESIGMRRFANFKFQIEDTKFRNPHSEMGNWMTGIQRYRPEALEHAGAKRATDGHFSIAFSQHSKQHGSTTKIWVDLTDLFIWPII